MITKETAIDRMEILEDGQIQVRKVTRILEDGKLIGQSFHRHVVAPDEDISSQDEKVKSVANALWTKEVKDEFKKNKSKNNGN